MDDNHHPMMMIDDDYHKYMQMTKCFYFYVSRIDYVQPIHIQNTHSRLVQKWNKNVI